MPINEIVIFPNYAALAQFGQHHVTRETAVRQPFLDLLRAAAGQRGWSLEPEFPMQGSRGSRIVVDAALRDAFWRVHGYWEAKDSDDDLEAEVRHVFNRGCPDSDKHRTLCRFTKGDLSIRPERWRRRFGPCLSVSPRYWRAQSFQTPAPLSIQSAMVPLEPLQPGKDGASVREGGRTVISICKVVWRA